jgi:D-lactate dehydrogenase
VAVDTAELLTDVKAAVEGPSHVRLICALRATVGRAHVLTGKRATVGFRTGFRFGEGAAEAAVLPGSLVELWRVLKTCHACDRIVIMQAANTGLTGGSTPHGADYDRPVIVINTMRIVGVHLVDGGRQVVCLPGATLYELERTLRPLGREPHSVIGSSCIGASVLGGICNNSGGALVRRGPAYTELTLYAQVDDQGELRLVNHLGIDLGDDPESMLRRLEAGAFTESDITRDPERAGSDRTYARHIRDVDAATPARFNADPSRLFEASGSAGKVVVFAARLDTFACDTRTAVFYIGSNAPDELETLRRDILGNFAALPVSGEYVHRTAFDIAERYGKDTFLAIRHLGTDRLPLLFALRRRIDAAAEKLGFPDGQFSDKLLQALSAWLPSHLPRRMKAYRDRFEHHLILKMADDGVEEARAHLQAAFPSATGDFFECEPPEAEAAFIHRFAVAGAAVRYRAVHAAEVEDIVAIDVALRRNERDWLEVLPDEIAAPILHRLYYGHFFCHVFHQDYIVAKGHDTHLLEQSMLTLLDERGAEYPAEHNVGHLYDAKPALVRHYKALDPCNCFNPGIGHTSKRRRWS